MNWQFGYYQTSIHESELAVWILSDKYTQYILK